MTRSKPTPSIREMLANLHRIDDAAHLDALCESLAIAAVQAQLDRAVSIQADLLARQDEINLVIEETDIVASYCADVGIAFTADELAWFRRAVRS